MKTLKLAVLLTIIFVTGGLLLGQSAPNLENGFKAFGSYQSGDLDTVNLQTGNLMFHVPVFSYPQRGGKLSANYMVQGSSKNWQVGTWTDTQHTDHYKWILTESPGVYSMTSSGVSFIDPGLFELKRNRHLATDLAGNQTYTVDDYAIATGDGGWHWLSGFTPGNHLMTMDGSGIQVVVTRGIKQDLSDDTATVIFRDGTHYFFPNISVPMPAQGTGNNVSGRFFHPELILDAFGTTQTAFDGAPAGSAIDANGNILSLATDTMGRNVAGTSSSTSDYLNCVTTRTITSANIFNAPGPDGRSSTLKICMTDFVPTAAFSQPNVAPPSSAVPAYQLNSFAQGHGSYIGSIVMPDQNHWSFDYDDFGNVTKITLPTGGSISYVWTEISDSCANGSLTRVSRAVSTRTTNDNNGHSYQWSYTWGPLQQDGTITNYVLDPNGNETAHVFHSVTIAPCDFYEVETRSYQGTHASGTLLHTVDNHYQADFGYTAESSFAADVVPDIITTTLPNGPVSKVVRQYDSGNGAGMSTYGKVTDEKVYDYSGALLKETATTYQWQVNSTYLDAGFLDLPASVVVKDGAGCALAETDYIYDEANYLTAYTGTLPAGTHQAAPGGTARGNLTTVKKWLAPTSSCSPLSGTAITSHVKWYDTGVPYQTIDPLGHTTSLSYDSAYAGAYVTQTCSPQTGTVTHCVSGTYDSITGLLESLTNENAATQASGNTPGDSGHTSNFAYDTSWRLTSAQAPPDPGNANARATTTFTPSVANAFPLSVQRSRSITTSASDFVTTTFDGLARPFETQHTVPGNAATVMTTYDGLGQIKTVTNPYFTTSDPTYGTTQMLYDGLGRAYQTTRQDGSISAANYGQSPCTTTTDEAGKQRRTCADAMGRLVEVDEPNSAANATAAYGTLSISGTLQSHLTSGSAAVKAAATVGVWSGDGSGADMHIDDTSDPCPPLPQTCPQIYDSGWVRVTVNGIASQISYSHFTTSSSLASSLVSAINSSGANVYVTAAVSNSTNISLQAKNAGAAGNSITVSAASATNDPGDFGGGSFGGSASGGTLTGGADAINPVTIWDQGIVTLTIGSFIASAPYSQTGNSTSALVASALASSGSTGLNRAGSPVSAVATGSSITLTYATPGTAGNGVTETPSSQSTQTLWTFSPSFAGSSTTLGNALAAGDVSNNPLVTLYQYDGLGNLICVEQHGGVTGTGCSALPSSDATSPWRVRRFSYDSLSRLLTAHNPESGTITYSYDADGNLLQKTSPAPNQTGTATQTVSFCYDELHRVTGKGYGAQNCPLSAPVVTYAYDSGANSKGKLTSLTDQAGTASYTYDPLGRLTAETRSIAGVPKNIGYSYNLDGSVKTLTYPSNRVVTFTPDSAGRLVSAVDGNGTNYVMSASYNPDGSVKNLLNGSTPALNQSFQYTPRLQMCRITALTSGTLPTSCTDTLNIGNVMDRGYDFHAGNGAAGSGSDNGNVFGITNYRDANRSQAFTYDLLNRLTSGWSSANTGSYSWGENYSIDAWGNLQISPMGGKAHGGNFMLSGNAQNRPIGLTYDGAGNLISYLSASYTYDQENRLASTAGTTYTYDGNGERVLKSNTSTGAPTKRYWSMGGNTLAEGDGSGNLTAEYIYFGGKRVARIDLPANTIHYYLSDHLGSTSLVASAGGAIEEESDYYPFGTEVVVTGGVNELKFTGKRRDTESQLDYFGARYYFNSFGHFMNPDPLNATPGHLVNPQRWNAYAYVMNNPLFYIDPDGRDEIAVNFFSEVPIGGHEGIIVVHADGSATYARFGPQGGNKPFGKGEVQTRSLSKVQFQANGLPTDQSYKDMAKEVADLEGQDPNTVGFNYFKTSETDSMLLQDWIERIQKASNEGKAPDYDVTRSNCTTFCIVGLIAGHAIKPDQSVNLTPNRLFMILAPLATENYSWGQRTPKEKVTHKFAPPCGEHGQPKCQ